MNKIIFVHIKILRGNFFLFISNHLGKLIFNKSCGGLGFKNIQKRTEDALHTLLLASLQQLSNLDTTNQLFLKIEGAKKEFLRQINIQFISVLKQYNMNIFTIKLINKISHSGCRKSYFRK
uniref:Ribosomal protein S11 n=1 Tax=Rhizaria sp. TaxID=2204297 RepID=A0A5P8DJW2_9EUKA|nr:ribosomal protein S11 [Rhizaria sp.]